MGDLDRYGGGPPERPRMPFSMVVVIGALAAFGAISLIQWTLGWLFGIVKFGLVVVVVAAVLGLLLWGGPDD